MSKTKWQTIDTAPKDGTFYLAHNGVLQKVLNQPPGHKIGRWHQRGAYWYGASEDYFEPTHWQPLPAIT